ncbi:MAG TPA: pantoate--beta-alanine ligase [Polyangiales bacterium]|nr:pantoate--beta-alanine ligase [Polyangiales bacterium]
MAQIIRDARELFERCEHARREGARVGFVPTMGALHDGHLALVDEATRRGATLRVVSIFVNPLQFGVNEDFGRYPRTLEADVERCEARGVELIYSPPPERMYPPGFQTHVEVEQVTQRWEGTFRPTHFRGVTTVVTKLLLAVGPSIAVFGRKDFQQFKTLSRLVQDLDIPVELVGMPTVREADGLALSSRNRYLAPSERERALAIARGLRKAYDAYASGQRAGLAELARAEIEAAFDRIDYVEAVHPDTLEPLETPSDAQLILVAAHVGKTRLIDNLWLGHDARP